MTTPLTRPRTPEELRAAVRAGAANRPGVYRMIGPGDEVLYIGKSIRLRSRLLSYLRARRGEKAAELIGHTHRIAWEYTPSEFASLLLEMRLIRRWRPPYNVEHKRDRAFCFMKLTREEAPRLLVVHGAKRDGALYYGPFRGPQRVRALVREVVDLLQLRDCAATTPLRFADQLDLFGREHTPLCMRADVQRCLAPCAARCTRSEYQEQMSQARRFLEGDVDIPLSILRRRMEGAAARLQFEYASELRDRASRLDEARRELLALRRSIEALTFLYPVPGYAGDDRLYVIRRGSIRAELPLPRDDAQWQAVWRRADTIFAVRERGLGGVRGDQAAEALLLARWFRLRPGELEKVSASDRSLVRESARLLASL